MSDTRLRAAVHQRLRTGQPPTIEQTYALLRIIDDRDTLYRRAGQMNDVLYAAIATCGLQVVCVTQAGHPLAWAYQWDGDIPIGRFTTPSAALGAGLAAQWSTEANVSRG